MTPTRAARPCTVHGCPQLQPCPVHARKPWATSKRADRLDGRSGWDRQAERRRILRRHKGICHVCGQPGSDTVDHVIPLAEGGQDIPGNLAPIHSTPCHRDKSEAEKRAGIERRRRGRPT